MSISSEAIEKLDDIAVGLVKIQLGKRSHYFMIYSDLITTISKRVLKYYNENKSDEDIKLWIINEYKRKIEGKMWKEIEAFIGNHVHTDEISGIEILVE